MKKRWKKRGAVTSLILLMTMTLSYTVIISLWDLQYGAVEIERDMLHSLPTMYALDLGCEIQSVMMDWETMLLQPWEGTIEINGVQLLWNEGMLEVRQPKR